MIDYDKMNALASQFYFPFIDRQHGKLGINALRQILGFIQQFYLHVAPETRTSRILVFKHLNDLPADVLSGAHEAQSVHHMPALSQEPIVVQIFENGRMLLS